MERQAALLPVIAVLKLPAGATPGQVHAALNKTDQHGALPIHDLLDQGDPGLGLVRAMLAAGGDAMLAVAEDYSKELPLHCAAHRLKNADGPAVVELLLARGPPGSATSENRDGRTPLAMAESFNTSPVAEEIKALLRAAMRWRHGAPRAGRRGGGVPGPPLAASPDPLRESLCGVCLGDRDLNSVRPPPHTRTPRSPGDACPPRGRSFPCGLRTVRVRM